MKIKNAIIVGRYQTHVLCAEQIEQIQSIIATHSRTILILGNALVKGTIKNPLDFRARKVMITDAFPLLQVYYVTDSPNDDALWSRSIDKIIEQQFGWGDFIPENTIYGSQDTVVNKYVGKYKVAQFECSTYVSEAELRKAAASYPPTEAFRAGIVAAQVVRYPTSYQAVDIAILNKGNILLGRKANEIKFRFIGGFSDPASSSLEADARREVQEETGVEIDDIRYLGSARVDLDARYRNEYDKIKTALFVAKYIFGRPTAMDDIVELKWIPIVELHPDHLVQTHHQLLEMFTEQFMKNPELVAKYA
jgi:bifunctional NMN adenylyltransferase/nudix hydrolase